MKRSFTYCVLSGLLLSLTPVWSDDKPKLTTAEIMRKAHGKDNLVRKLAMNQATEADKRNLIEYYEALRLNKPNKGDEKAWRKRTDELLAAAKEAVKDCSKFPRLRQAVDCKQCHDLHKQ